VLIALPAAFLLAFGARHRLSAALATVSLGVGSAVILDEVLYWLRRAEAMKTTFSAFLFVEPSVLFP
jgi:hypothetical protein